MTHSEATQGPRITFGAGPGVHLADGSSGAQVPENTPPQTTVVDIRRGQPGERSRLDQILEYLKALTRRRLVLVSIPLGRGRRRRAGGGSPV